MDSSILSGIEIRANDHEEKIFCKNLFSVLKAVQVWTTKQPRRYSELEVSFFGAIEDQPNHIPTRQCPRSSYLDMKMCTDKDSIMLIVKINSFLPGDSIRSRGPANFKKYGPLVTALGGRWNPPPVNLLVTLQNPSCNQSYFSRFASMWLLILQTFLIPLQNQIQILRIRSIESY